MKVKINKIKSTKGDDNIIILLNPSLKLITTSGMMAPKKFVKNAYIIILTKSKNANVKIPKIPPFFIFTLSPL